jgi:hypothetical protein
MSSIPDNPDSYIKNPTEMGITDKGDEKSINKTLSAFKKYNNALYSGKTNAFKVDTKDEPLGNRYFAKVSGVYNEDGEKVDRYVSVDNMKYPKDVDRRFNLQNTGLLHSAKATVDSINPYSLLDSDKMVEVEMKSNADGDIIKQTIGIGDYKKMDCTAFPNRCKAYKGKSGCEPCFVKEKVKENMHDMTSSNAKRDDKSHDERMKKHDDMNNKLYYHDIGISRSYPLYLYNINETKDVYESDSSDKDSVIENDDGSDDDNDSNKTNINNVNNVNKSVLTVYLGGLSVVGLYIVYRFLNKRK